MRLVDNNFLVAEGMGNVEIQRKDVKKAIIDKVLFVSGIKFNMMIVGQLVEKGFSVLMENDTLKLFDKTKRLILKSTLSKNITFKTSIKVAEANCLAATMFDNDILL